MKLFILTSLLTTVLFNANAQVATQDSANFKIYKFESPIGTESYRVDRSGTGINYHILSNLDDRGDRAELRAELILNVAGMPLEYTIYGATSGGSKINDSVNLGHANYLKNAGSLFFPVHPYADATTRQELIRFWERMHRPKSLTILKKGTVHIRFAGNEIFMTGEKRLTLQRYIINLLFHNLKSKSNFVSLLTKWLVNV